MCEQIKKIADHYGFEHQLKKTQEEILELWAAIHDYRKDPEDIVKEYHLYEEVADVAIMIEQLRYLTSKGSKYNVVNYFIKFKLDRQIERMSDKNNE